MKIMNNFKEICRELYNSESAGMYIAGILFAAVLGLGLVAHIIKAVFFSGWASFLFWAGWLLIIVGWALISDAINNKSK